MLEGGIWFFDIHLRGVILEGPILSIKCNYLEDLQQYLMQSHETQTTFSDFSEAAHFFLSDFEFFKLMLKKIKSTHYVIS